MGEVDGDAGALRSGVEELRSAVRDLQRQQRQAPRSWRSEIEAAIDAVQGKFADAQREAAELLSKDVHAELDKRFAEANRLLARRSTALEESFEASQASTSAETSALRSELAGAISALAKKGPDAAPAVVQAHGQAQVEARLSILEQQLEGLKASITSSSRPRPSESLTGQALERKAEALDHKVSALEAKLKEQNSQLSDRLNALRRAADEDHVPGVASVQPQLKQLQVQIEELRDRSNDGFRASAASLASVEASGEAWRQRTERALRETEQKLAREVEQRLLPVKERVASEAKAAASVAVSEAEAARRKMEERIGDQLQQLTSHIQSVHDSSMQNHEASGSSISAMLERLGRAELATAEELGDRERRFRQLEERLEEVCKGSRGTVLPPGGPQGPGVGDPTTPNRDAARMSVQLEVQEKEAKKLARELQSVSKTVERLSEEQRRLSQEQVADVSRQDASRMEERRSSDKADKRLRARIEELEMRMDGLEPLPTELDGKLSEIQGRLWDEVTLKLQTPEVRLQELSSKLAEQETRHTAALREATSKLHDSLADVRGAASAAASAASGDFEARLQKVSEQHCQEAQELRRAQEQQLEAHAEKLEKLDADVRSQTALLEERHQKQVEESVTKLEKRLSEERDGASDGRKQLGLRLEQLMEQQEKHGQRMGALEEEQAAAKARLEHQSSMLQERLDLNDFKLMQHGQEMSKKLQDVLAEQEQKVEKAQQEQLQREQSHSKMLEPMKSDLQALRQSTQQSIQSLQESLQQHESAAGRDIAQLTGELGGVSQQLQELQSNQRSQAASFEQHLEKQYGHVRQELAEHRDLQAEQASQQSSQQAEQRRALDGLERDLSELKARVSSDPNASKLEALEAKASKLETSLWKIESASSLLETAKSQLELDALKLETGLAEVKSGVEPLSPRLSSVEATVKELIQQVGSRLQCLDDGLLALQPRLLAAEQEIPRVVAVTKQQLSAEIGEVRQKLDESVQELKKLEETQQEEQLKDLRQMEGRLQHLQERQGQLQEQQGQLGEHQGQLLEQQGQLREQQGKLEEKQGQLQEQQGQLQEQQDQLQDQLRDQSQLQSELKTQLQDQGQLQGQMQKQQQDMQTELQHAWEAAAGELQAQATAQAGGLSGLAEKVEEAEKALKATHDAFEHRLATLEPTVAKVARLEPLVGHLESRAQSIEELTKEVDRGRELLQEEQRTLSLQLQDHQAVMEASQAKASEALRQVAAKVKAVEQELTQQVLAEATKSREAHVEQCEQLKQSIDGIGVLEDKLRDGEERADRMAASMQEADAQLSQLSRRLEEAKSAQDKQGRALLLLQHGQKDQERTTESLRQQVDHDREAVGKAAAEASSAAVQTADASKQLLSEHAEREKSLVRRFERWSTQAKEQAAAQVLEAQNSAINDLLDQVNSQVDRYRLQARSDCTKVRDELFQVLKSSSSVFEGKAAELEARFKRFAEQAAGSIGELSTDIERVRQKGESSLMQESSLDCFGGPTPGLRELRTAVEEESRRRDEESRRLHERLLDSTVHNEEQAVRAYPKGRDSPALPTSNQQKHAGQRERGPASNAVVLDGLRGCEVAISSLDRRVTSLEDSLEDKLYSMVRGDLQKSAAVQKGQLQEMEQKMENLVNVLHTPSAYEAAMRESASAESAAERGNFRRQFRSALGDSMYVKKALRAGNRSSSVDTIRNHPRV
eukprot:TRINITY_DN37230_c0_g1_i1.p1 TRINITY_DN37230_c0_g1~~TRINITY_DN37230_c0_g1_i1.p1  ORF type:complete len:1796 (-),score=582.29 TRINITY_DN37230_c0_g1_i1:97-5184(-)